MSPAILDPTATNDFAIQSGLPLNPELSMNHGIIASSVGTVPSYLTYDIRRLMLNQFSTAQVTEDKCWVTDRSLLPHELIEIRRICAVLTLPQTILNHMQPYWEGWVKSLRVLAEVRKKTAKKWLGKERENGDGSDAVNRRRGKLAWRDHWVFVENGVLNAQRKGRLSPISAQLHPLDLLTEIRGSERMGRSFAARHQSSLQRIVCMRFQQTASTTKHVYPPDLTKNNGNQSPSVEVDPARLAQSHNHELGDSALTRARLPAITDSLPDNDQGPHRQNHHSYGERPTIRGHTLRSETHSVSRSRTHVHHQEDSKSEWVIMDLGEDHGISPLLCLPHICDMSLIVPNLAFKSFLEILHHHAPQSVSSSFIQPPLADP
ncbi:hypothetical protein PM082_024464 [Marasmius tenuissimus]|nr:hypothetical protein PM082_024464 [Marasmius tenuissimus]